MFLALFLFCEIENRLGVTAYQLVHFYKRWLSITDTQSKIGDCLWIQIYDSLEYLDALFEVDAGFLYLSVDLRCRIQQILFLFQIVGNYSLYLLFT